MTGKRPQGFWAKRVAAVLAVIAAGCIALFSLAPETAPPQIQSLFDASTTAGTPPIFTSGEQADVPSTFDTSAWVIASSLPPASTNGDFRSNCEVSHLAYDDPLLYHDQPGVSHLHMFYGNPSTDSHSTYASLRAAANTQPGTSFTCGGGPLNASAYWHPALLKDNVECDASHPGTETCAIRPDYALIYYKVGTGLQNGTVRMPRGLGMVFGRALASGALVPTSQVNYNCGASSAKYLANTDGSAALNCTASDELAVWMTGPRCWNGTSLGSGDFRTHMAFDSGGACPPTHPYMIPHYELIVRYTHGGSEDLKTWYASSDRMPGYPAYRNGESMHTDAFFAWDYPTMTKFMVNCNGLNGSPHNCSDGALGDGTKLKTLTSVGGPVNFSDTVEGVDRYMKLPSDAAPVVTDPVAGYKKGSRVRPRMHMH